MDGPLCRETGTPGKDDFLGKPVMQVKLGRGPTGQLYPFPIVWSIRRFAHRVSWLGRWSVSMAIIGPLCYL